MPHALVVDPDPSFRQWLIGRLQEERFSTSSAASLYEARMELAKRAAHVVLVELSLPDGSGIELVEDIEATTMPEVIVVTWHPSVATVVAAMRHGASDYLAKPVDFAAVKRVLDKVSRARELQERIDALRAELGRLGGVGRLIGASAAMQKVYGLMLRAPRGAVILVLGERGTGKELVALTLHELSERRDRPFVPVECSAISPSLVENELFGDERSSYKDVDRAGGSYFEQAHRGTLFLDEISELPLPLQAKLLRVIMTGAIPRADGVRIRVDVRVIAASSRRLEEGVEAGAFRASLLYEINAFPIHLPPLRERKEDIELLAQYFLGQLNREHGTAKPFTPAAIERLRGFSWPGNVPHLRSVVHKAFLLSENGIDALTIVLPQEPTQFPIFPASRRDFERRYTVWTLEQCGGDKKRTAEMLGISLKTLYNWLKKYRSE